jgi:hypothetical protein
VTPGDCLDNNVWVCVVKVIGKEDNSPHSPDQFHYGLPDRSVHTFGLGHVHANPLNATRCAGGHSNGINFDVFDSRGRRTEDRSNRPGGAAWRPSPSLAPPAGARGGEHHLLEVKVPAVRNSLILPRYPCLQCQHVLPQGPTPQPVSEAVPISSKSPHSATAAQKLRSLLDRPLRSQHTVLWLVVKPRRTRRMEKKEKCMTRNASAASSLFDQAHSRVMSLRNVGANPLYAITPSFVRVLWEATENEGEGAESGRVSETLSLAFDDIFVSAKTLAVTLHVGPLNHQSCDEERIREEVAITVVRMIGQSIVRSPSNWVQAEGRSIDGQASTRSQYGLLLLAEFVEPLSERQIQNHFWDLLPQMAVWAYLRELQAKQAEVEGGQPGQDVLIHGRFRFPSPAAERVDFDSLGEQFLLWEHLRRQGHVLPLPAGPMELLAALRTRRCPPWLARKIHDAAVGMLVESGDYPRVLSLDPEYVVLLVEVAAAALAGWEEMPTLQLAAPGGRVHEETLALLCYASMATATQIAFLKSRATEPYPEASIDVGAALSQRTFTDIKRSIVAACEADGIVVHNLVDEMPAWARTVINYAMGFRQKKKSGMLSFPGPTSSRFARKKEPGRREGVLFLDEAADYLGVGESTIRYWVAKKQIIPSRFPHGKGKHPGQYVFTKEVLEDMRLLTLSNEELAEKAGVSVATLRRQMTAIRKKNPGMTRTEVRRSVLSSGAD